MQNTYLSTLRRRLPGCERVVLVDTSTGTGLASEGAFDAAQEDIDHLTAVTKTVLDASPGAADCAMVSDATGVLVLMRVPQQATEALCLVFDPTATLPDLPKDAHALFAECAQV